MLTTLEELAFTLSIRGELWQQRDLQKCLKDYRHSLELYETLGQRWETANLLERVGGLIGFREGDHVKALQMLEQSIMLRRSLKDQLGLADALILAGHEAVLQGSPQKGERLLQESLSIRREAGFQTTTTDAVIFSLLCTGFILLGRYAEVHRLLRHDFLHLAELENRVHTRFVSGNQGWTDLHLGRVWASPLPHPNGSIVSPRAQASMGLGDGSPLNGLSISGGKKLF